MNTALTLYKEPHISALHCELSTCGFDAMRLHLKDLLVISRWSEEQEGHMQHP